MKVEKDQLLYFAHHYLGLARRLAVRCARKKETIGQLFKSFPSARRDPAYLLLAHLASSSVRLSTLIEMSAPALDSFDYRQHLRNKSQAEQETELRRHLDRYLPMILRDQVGHDTKSATHPLAPARDRVLGTLTPEECLRHIEAAEAKIRGTLGC
jgi:hypothetical protein